jgi:putative hydrolase of HD superfamily
MDPTIASLLPILEAIDQLKALKRAGWVRVGVPNPESVAGHSYGVAMLALVLGPQLGVDVGRLLQLALVHDLGEARVGDLTPADGVSEAEKKRREGDAVAAIVAGLPQGSALVELWQEYAANATPEARIVHQLDKLDLAAQALAYEERDGLDLSEFWASARSALAEPRLIEIYDRLRALRPTADRASGAPRSAPRDDPETSPEG